MNKQTTTTNKTNTNKTNTSKTYAETLGKTLAKATSTTTTTTTPTRPLSHRTPTFRSYRKVDFHRFFIQILLKCLLESSFQRPFLAAGVVAAALPSAVFSTLS
jgi:predicted 2-oxoglutarate/Fe(II)-dependent dioxygenase YbiX